MAVVATKREVLRLNRTTTLLSSVAATGSAMAETSVIHENFSHCSRGALTDSFGWLIQAILAGLAFALLILKRFCEPKRHRRNWIIWFYDTSKQALGAMVIHFANVFLASLFNGDPCTWYIVSFLLDSSVGLFVIYVGIRTSQWIAHIKGWSALNFGEYGKPPEWQAWIGQCGVYICLMIIAKVIVTVIIQLQFWDQVREFILSPIKDPKVELAVVMLIIPFIVNALIFWVVDNFLMHRRRKVKDDGTDDDDVVSRKLRYHRKDKTDKAESEILLPLDDEEIINLGDALTSQHRNISSAAVS